MFKIDIYTPSKGTLKPKKNDSQRCINAGIRLELYDQN